MTYFKMFKNKLGRFGLASLLAVTLTAGAATGCTPNTAPQVEPGPVVQQPQVDEKAIMDEYKKRMANQAQPKVIFEFLNENAKALSKDNITIIINELEKQQKDSLPKLEEKYYAGEEIQNEFIKVYLEKKDINNPGSFESEGLKSLVEDTIKNGYKVETAEGMFFPVVSYSAYKDYTSYMSDDMKEYIEIMSTESDSVPAKDAALVIGWDELVDRALRQEAFINQYSNSSKLDQVQHLYKNYKNFVFLGLNNTPLFDYETKRMNEEAKAAYEKIDFSTNNSELKSSLKNYMELIKKNDYKLTKEVETFRNEVINK